MLDVEPSSQFLHLPVFLLLQLGDETLQDRHLKFDILRHLVEKCCHKRSFLN